jgi:hypothetical protein
MMDHLRIHHHDKLDAVVVAKSKLSSWTEKQEKQSKEDLVCCVTEQYCYAIVDDFASKD